jgi:uncharacterized protein
VRALAGDGKTGGLYIMTKADQLAAALDDLIAGSPDVEAAAVVSGDGLPMASALPPYVEEDRLAAMSAALLTLGERAAAGLGRGDLAQVFVEAAQGYVVLMAAGADAVLVAITSPRAKVGLVLYEMKRSAQRVAAIMGDGVAAAAPETAREAAGGAPTPAPDPIPAEDFQHTAVPAPHAADFGNAPVPASQQADPLEPSPVSPGDSAFSTWR